MSYKLIALDIDGTIRSNEYPLSDRTRAAIEAVQESGALVTLVTGRMFQSALHATDGLPLICPIVTSQGAHVADPKTGEVLWHRPLTPPMVMDALRALATWDGEVLAHHGDVVYANVSTPWVEAYGQRNRGQIRVVDDLGDVACKGLTRLVAVGDEDDIRELELRLTAHFDSQLQITHSLPNLCEILHPETGKDKALAWLCQHLGVGREQTAAFGNGTEDIPMLRWAGVGAAVSGSAPELLRVADRVAPPMEEDGVAQVLEDWLRRGLVG